MRLVTIHRDRQAECRGGGEGVKFTRAKGRGIALRAVNHWLQLAIAGDDANNTSLKIELLPPHLAVDQCGDLLCQILNIVGLLGLHSHLHQPR